MNRLVYLEDKDLERLFAANVYFYKQELFLPDSFFLTSEGLEYYKRAKVDIIEGLRDEEFERIIKQEKDLMDINLVKSEIIRRKKALSLEVLVDKPKEKILELKDRYETTLNFWHPMFYGVVGLNGNGKTSFSIYVANILAENFKTVFFLLEDNTIYSKLSQDIKNRVKFYKTKDLNSLIEKVIRDDYEIVFIDALTSLGRYEMKSYLDRGHFIHNLESLVSGGKSIFLINHITKKSKMEKKKENMSLVDAYSEEFINLIDIGFVISLNGDTFTIKIEKNRMELLDKIYYNFDFREIYNTITYDKVSKLREIKEKIKLKEG